MSVSSKGAATAFSLQVHRTPPFLILSAVFLLPVAAAQVSQKKNVLILSEVGLHIPLLNW